MLHRTTLWFLATLLAVVHAEFSEVQQNAVNTIPKVTGSLSIVGSCLICYIVAKRPKNKRNTYQRLVLSLSLMDIVGSTAFFSSTWMTVSGSGTTGTCNLQGFMVQLSFAVPLHNAILASNFLLRIRYSWSEDKTAKLFKYYMAIGYIFPVVTSFVALGLEQYNDSGPWCWIAAFPSGCIDSGPDANCLRGINWRVYQFAFFYIPLWICMLYTCWCMFKIARHVKRTEAAAVQFANRSSGSSQSLLVTRQAMLYSWSFILTWIFGTCNRLSQLFTEPIFALVFLHSFFVPLQGFFNAMVFLHPKYVRWKAKSGGGCIMLCCNVLSDCYYFIVGMGENPSKGLEDDDDDNQEERSTSMNESTNGQGYILDEDEIAGDALRRAKMKQIEQRWVKKSALAASNSNPTPAPSVGVADPMETATPEAVNIAMASPLPKDSSEAMSMELGEPSGSDDERSLGGRTLSAESEDTLLVEEGHQQVARV